MRNVIVVDDDPISLRVTATLLSGLNSAWCVVGFDTAWGALEYMERAEVDPLFAIIDVFLAEFDAFELLERRKVSSSQNYPIFLLSANVTREVAERAANIGQIRCVFSKPLHPGSLTYHLLMNGIRIH